MVFVHINKDWILPRSHLRKFSTLLAIHLFPCIERIISWDCVSGKPCPGFQPKPGHSPTRPEERTSARECDSTSENEIVSAFQDYGCFSDTARMWECGFQPELGFSPTRIEERISQWDSESESVAPVHVSARHVRPSSCSHVRILDIGESAVRLFRVGPHVILIQREARCWCWWSRSEQRRSGQEVICAI